MCTEVIGTSRSARCCTGKPKAKPNTHKYEEVACLREDFQALLILWAKEEEDRTDRRIWLVLYSCASLRRGRGGVRLRLCWYPKFPWIPISRDHPYDKPWIVAMSCTLFS